VTCALQAVVASLNGLGLKFDVSDIELVREPKEQVGVTLFLQQPELYIMP
jgi:hypothetical protein